MIATWQAGMACAPHDHGGGRGVVLVCEGRFIERRYSFDGATLEAGGSRVHRAGDLIFIDGSLIHDMVSCEPVGVTLHLYAEQDAPMRVYDSARRLTWTVGVGEGAWLPKPDAVADALCHAWRSQ